LLPQNHRSQITKYYSSAHYKAWEVNINHTNVFTSIPFVHLTKEVPFDDENSMIYILYTYMSACILEDAQSGLVVLYFENILAVSSLFELSL